MRPAYELHRWSRRFIMTVLRIHVVSRITKNFKIRCITKQLQGPKKREKKIVSGVPTIAIHSLTYQLDVRGLYTIYRDNRHTYVTVSDTAYTFVKSV